MGFDNGQFVSNFILETTAVVIDTIDSRQTNPAYGNRDYKRRTKTKNAENNSMEGPLF
jgi:hypothetical protein